MEAHSSVGQLIHGGSTGMYVGVITLLCGAFLMSTAKPAGSRYFLDASAPPQCGHSSRPVRASPVALHERQRHTYPIACTSFTCSTFGGTCQFNVTPPDSYTRPSIVTSAPGAYSRIASSNCRDGYPNLRPEKLSRSSLPRERDLLNSSAVSVLKLTIPVGKPYPGRNCRFASSPSRYSPSSRSS